MLNDSIAENECVADFTTSHDELGEDHAGERYGTRCGVINHYGWYEDAGYKRYEGADGQVAAHLHLF